MIMQAVDVSQQNVFNEKMIILWGIGRPLLLAMMVMALLSGCRDGLNKAVGGSMSVKELIYYGFAEDMPLSVLNDFTGEHGITIRYLPYESPEEAEDFIRTGAACDVVLIENQLFRGLIEDHLLARINHTNVPNFNNISAEFRDLAFDPDNRFSIPASYGTTGLIVRTDLVGHNLKRWADLWKPQYSRKIGLRAQPREIIGMTLTALGYPFASEDPQQLDAVLQSLLRLKPAVDMLNIESDDAVRRLLLGKIAILHGYAEDYHRAHAVNPAVAYVLPREGTALWAESYAIPGSSPHKKAAELFINFLLRPDITARIINEKKYAQPNDAALTMVQPDIRNDPVVFPDDKALRHGSIIQPLSQEGKTLYRDVWTRFMEEQN